MQETYYFAYGSSLNANGWASFRQRTGFEPDCIEALEPAILPDMRLSVDNYSTSHRGCSPNIVPARGHIVEGVLYRVSAEGWQELNRKEGASFRYERIKRTALCLDGTCVPVITYAVTEKWREPFCSPTAGCQQIDADGLQDWKLSATALDAAAKGKIARPTIETLFVYGTLMSGQTNSQFIPPEMIRSIQRASVSASLYDSGSGFPALVLDEPDAGTVWGELVHVEEMPALLQKLDWLEGFRGYGKESLFHRLLLEITGEDGQSLRAWCYAAAHSDLLRVRIDHGCWKTYAS